MDERFTSIYAGRSKTRVPKLSPFRQKKVKDSDEDESADNENRNETENTE